MRTHERWLFRTVALTIALSFAPAARATAGEQDAAEAEGPELIIAENFDEVQSAADHDGHAARNSTGWFGGRDALIGPGFLFSEVFPQTTDLWPAAVNQAEAFLHGLGRRLRVRTVGHEQGTCRRCAGRLLDTAAQRFNGELANANNEEPRWRPVTEEPEGECPHCAGCEKCRKQEAGVDVQPDELAAEILDIMDSVGTVVDGTTFQNAPVFVIDTSGSGDDGDERLSSKEAFVRFIRRLEQQHKDHTGKHLAVEPLTVVPRETRIEPERPADDWADQVRALRDAAFDVEQAAEALERNDLYDQADHIRALAQQLRVEARGLKSGSVHGGDDTRTARARRLPDCGSSCPCRSGPARCPYCDPERQRPAGFLPPPPPRHRHHPSGFDRPAPHGPHYDGPHYESPHQHSPPGRGKPISWTPDQDDVLDLGPPPHDTLPGDSPAQSPQESGTSDFDHFDTSGTTRPATAAPSGFSFPVGHKDTAVREALGLAHPIDRSAAPPAPPHGAEPPSPASPPVPAGEHRAGSGDEPQLSLSLASGQRQVLRLLPFALGWTNSDPQVVQLEPKGDQGVELVGNRPGTALVTVWLEGDADGPAEKLQLAVKVSYSDSADSDEE